MTDDYKRVGADGAVEGELKPSNTFFKPLPPAYHKFVDTHRTFWLALNSIGVIVSILMGWVDILVMQIDISQRTIETECLGIQNALYGLLILHIVNAFFCLLCLCGLEKKLCNTMFLVLFFVFDAAILTWTQTTYFKSQALNCIDELPETYFWLMLEILFFYLLTMYIVCYFFRRYCQDPYIIQEEAIQDEKDKQEALAAQESDIQIGAPVTNNELLPDVTTADGHVDLEEHAKQNAE